MEINYKPTLNRVKEVIFPTANLIAISRFIDSNRQVFDMNVLQSLIDEEAEVGNHALDGISRIETEMSKDGEVMYIVVLKEDAFPPNIALGPGMADLKRGVCFIQEGFSKAAHEMIRAHEIYHLEHGKASIGYKLAKKGVPLALVIHEVETVVASNLLKNPVASGMVPLEWFLKMHKFSPRWIRHFRSELHDICDGTVLNTPLGR